MWSCSGRPRVVHPANRSTAFGIVTAAGSFGTLLVTRLQWVIVHAGWQASFGQPARLNWLGCAVGFWFSASSQHTCGPAARRGHAAASGGQGAGPFGLLAAQRGVLRLWLPRRLYRHAPAFVPHRRWPATHDRGHGLVADWPVQHFRLVVVRLAGRPLPQEVFVECALLQPRRGHRLVSLRPPDQLFRLALRRPNRLLVAGDRAVDQRTWRRYSGRATCQRCTGLSFSVIRPAVSWASGWLVCSMFDGSYDPVWWLAIALAW